MGPQNAANSNEIGLTEFVKNRDGLSREEFVQGLVDRFYPKMKKLAHSSLLGFERVAGKNGMEGRYKTTALANEAFVRLSKHWGTRDCNSKMLSGMCWTAMNRILIDYVKDISRANVLDDFEKIDGELDNAREERESHEKKLSRIEWLSYAIDGLSQRDDIDPVATQIMRFRFTGHTFREIADLVSLSKSRVNEICQQALEILKQQSREIDG